ncbi:MAG: SxtJ family membrane protein [Vicinamibacterales bacterium]
MQWSDVTRAQTPTTLRQFGLLSLVVFGGMAAWRALTGHVTTGTWVLGGVGGVLGLVGLVRPGWLGPVFTAWMAVAFPIGWVVSRVVLAVLYYLVFTPVAVVFRLMHRDALGRRRRTTASYWLPKPQPTDSTQYFKQF